jgi:hypothetical protein
MRRKCRSARLYHSYISAKGNTNFPVDVIATAKEALNLLHPHMKSGGSEVGILTGYGLDDGGAEVRVPERSRIVTSPYRPAYRSDRPWGSLIILSKSSRGFFPGNKAVKA